MILRAACLAVVALLTPGHALAHGTITGTSDFYDGVFHPLTVPAHLLALLGLGLWLGQHRPRELERAIIGFAVSLIIGSALGMIGSVGEITPILLAAALALGLLVAAERHLAWLGAAVIAAGVGLLVGADSAPDGANALQARIITLAGTFIGAHLLLLNLMAIVSLSERAWSRIAVRITGSWVAAITILVLALNFQR
ncbi:MAG: HupE/UreJ family protein [Alphaproteobacteria bacterium]